MWISFYLLYSEQWNRHNVAEAAGASCYVSYGIIRVLHLLLALKTHHYITYGIESYC